MSFIFDSPYILPLFFSAIISVVVAAYVWTRRSTPSAIALILLSLVIAEWALTYALELAGTDLATKLLWGKLQYLGIATTPLFWLIFAFNHANRGNQLTHWRMLLLALMPIVTIILAFTTEFHGLIWSEFSVATYPDFSALALGHGWWFWVHTAYSYLLLIAGTYIVLRSIGRLKGLYRGQTVALITAMLVPFVANFITIANLSPIPNLDLTPFGFTVSILGLAWGIFGFRLIDISPVAREMVVETMREGMLVLNSRGQVADINPAAARMIGVPVAQAIGKSITEILSPWPHLLDRFRGVTESNDMITVGQGEAQRHYAVRISPLQDRQMHLVGRVITIQDLNEPGLPEPRFAPQNLPQPEPIPADGTVEPKTSNFLQAWVTDFFTTPPILNLPTPEGLNPSWVQARERSFTIILRVAALLGTLTLLVAPSFTKLAAGGPFAIIIGLFWVLGLARRIDFKARTYVFLGLVYAMACVEMYNFGYSAASFTFFMTLVVAAALLVERKDWIITFALTVITIGTFGWLIGQGIYLPINANEGIPVPNNLQRALTNTLAFTASAAALLTSVTILIESLNQAWRKESQALNLLQQERDLLEQRVVERTQALAEARDAAVQSSNDLRKYFLAMEQSGNTIIITDTDGKIEYANPKFESLTGYARAEALGKNPRLLKSGKHEVSYYKNLWETITSGQIWRGEFHNRRKDGSLFWELATIAPLINPDGEITNYVAIKEDISAQKELQQQLQDFLNDLKALQEISLELSQEENLENLYVQMIRLAQEKLSLDRVGLFITDLEAGELRGTFGVSKTGEVRSEQYYREKLTEDHWSVDITNAQNHAILWEDAPLMDEGEQVGHGWKAASALWNGQRAIGYLVSDAFVSRRPARPYEVELLSLLGNTFGHLLERKQTEAQLLNSEARFRQIVENASDIIYRTDVKGYINYVNPTAVSLMNFANEGEALGKFYLDIAIPSARHKLKRFYDRQFLSRTQSSYYEFPAMTQDGREIWLGQSVQLITDGNEITGFQAVSRDITAIKRTQEALAISRDQALEASRLKSQLLSRVSHELRTPLGTVIGYAELLTMNAFGELNGEQTEVAFQIMESADYLSKMVNDLLDQAQVESKNMSLHRANFSPASLLQKVRAGLEILAENKGLELVTTLAPEVPAQLYGDEHRLQQILINLAGNAIKFTRSGKVEIKVYQAAPLQWAVQVSDTGAGIPKEAQGYIFDPFRQVDNSITRENRGTGLGLSITKQLVELMDGRISLESEPGRGSTFTVTLPITQKPEKAA